MGSFYEPWRPRVGQRVRIKLNDECQRPNSEGSAALHMHMSHGHLLAIDGMLGTVADPRHWWPPLSIPDVYGHHYVVQWDQPLTLDGWPRPVGADRFAAIELEPVGHLISRDEQYEPDEEDGDPYAAIAAGKVSSR